MRYLRHQPLHLRQGDILMPIIHHQLFNSNEGYSFHACKPGEASTFFPDVRCCHVQIDKVTCKSCLKKPRKQPSQIVLGAR